MQPILIASMNLLLITILKHEDNANRTALRTGDPFFVRPTLAAEKGEGGKAEVVSHGQEDDGSCRHVRVRGERKNEQGANLICNAFSLFFSSFRPSFAVVGARIEERRRTAKRMTRRHDDKSKERDGGSNEPPRPGSVSLSVYLSCTLSDPLPPPRPP